MIFKFDFAHEKLCFRDYKKVKILKSLGPTNKCLEKITFINKQKLGRKL